MGTAPAVAAAISSEDTVTTDTSSLLDEPMSVLIANGLPGLSSSSQWVLRPMGSDAVEGSPFRTLTSVEDTDPVTLILADPWAFFSDYAPDLPDNELEALGITDPGDVTVLCPVTLDAEQGCFYLNLLGPVVFHSGTGQAAQLVLGDQEWPIRAQVDVGP